ncbi:hypothetical protein IWQ60_003832 [Tieghemiomyces parasiticus]|uniref:PX domain-containing protein n=1 Tax=Tieghemiomyces parasiticus TaxID=78921 RepID=A0A9W8E0B7_9FUNG|nr:hypothetical protein IWQ60_003832 [Tieghemiomyces parasiticus]
MALHERLQTALNLSYELSVALKAVTDNILIRKVRRIQGPQAPELEDVDVLNADAEDLTLCVRVLKHRAHLRDTAARLAKIQYQCFYDGAKELSPGGASKAELASQGQRLIEAVRDALRTAGELVPTHERVPELTTFLASDLLHAFLDSAHRPTTLHSTAIAEDSDEDAPSMYQSVYNLGASQPTSPDADQLLTRARDRLASFGPATSPPAGSNSDQLLWSQAEMDPDYLSPASAARRRASADLPSAHHLAPHPVARSVSRDGLVDLTSGDEDDDTDTSGQLSPLTDSELAAQFPDPQPIFATEITVTDPVRVGFGLQSYVVFKCRAIRPDGTEVSVRRRYTDFENLRRVLARCYRPFRKGIPRLPEKKVIGNFERDFLERRQHGLQYFLSYVVLHPIIGTSPVLKKWFNVSSAPAR